MSDVPAQWRWRDEVRVASGLNLLTGIWLVLLPSIIGFRHHDAAWNPIVFGALIAALALTRITDVAHTKVLSFINAAVGVWLVVSAFLLAQSPRAVATVALTGVAVMLFGLMSAAATEQGAVE